MKIAVLDADTLGSDVSLSPLAACGELIVYGTTAPEELLDRIRDVDVTVQNKVKLPGDILRQTKSLKLICEAATGFDNIDTAAAKEMGIAVCNVPGYSTASVVQLTLAIVLSLATNLPAFADNVASGTYSRGNAANCLTPVFHELAGRTWGIIGYGNIGRGVADVARAIGCRVLAYRRNPKEGDPCVSLEEICRECDVITLHTPLNDGTRGLIGERELAMMKPHAILVNVARGAVTDEAAVARAVLDGRIGGFGCDVYSREPFHEDHPFFSLIGHGHVCLTPHMAWGSFEARTRCVETMAANIRSFVAGGRDNRIV